MAHCSPRDNTYTQVGADANLDALSGVLETRGHLPQLVPRADHSLLRVRIAGVSFSAEAPWIPSIQSDSLGFTRIARLLSAPLSLIASRVQYRRIHPSVERNES